MTGDAGKQLPHLTPQASAARVARLDREAAALRENLRRRKVQVRARSETGSTTDQKNTDQTGPGTEI